MTKIASRGPASRSNTFSGFSKILSGISFSYFIRFAFQIALKKKNRIKTGLQTAKITLGPTVIPYSGNGMF